MSQTQKKETTTKTEEKRSFRDPNYKPTTIGDLIRQQQQLSQVTQAEKDALAKR